MDFGPRLAGWRKSKGWTQKQLAENSKLSRASICYIEAGQQYPAQESFAAILGALGVTPERFYGRIPKPKRSVRAARAGARPPP